MAHIVVYIKRRYIAVSSATCLSGALTNYLTRNKGKIVFRKGLSLNGLALAMWEQSNACGIDPSILSKVLCGKRLFTPRYEYV